MTSYAGARALLDRAGVLPGMVTLQNGPSIDGSALRQALREASAATGTATSVASSASSVNIINANPNRIQASIFNESTQILYLLLSGGVTNFSQASTTNYSVQIPSNTRYEIPYNYQGQVVGIWAAANGFARITEITT